MQNPSFDSPVRNGEGSPSPGGAASRDLGGSSREAGATLRNLGGSSREVGGSSREAGATSRNLGGSSREVGGSFREVGASSSPIRSLDGSDQKSSNSDARSRERWRSVARRGSLAEGVDLRIPSHLIREYPENILSSHLRIS